jgi:hypothetical protein
MTERNRDGLIPGQQVDHATIMRVERARRLRANEAGAAPAAPVASVDFSQPWFSLRKQVEELTGVRPESKRHARELVEEHDAGEA